jgi:protein phosphatase PTC1
MIVRFDKQAILESQNNRDNPIGVEGDSSHNVSGKVSEADKIVSSTRQKIAEGGTPAVGISASNSGRGHDPVPIEDGEKTTTFTPSVIEGSVEEEPSSLGDSDHAGEGRTEDGVVQLNWPKAGKKESLAPS